MKKFLLLFLPFILFAQDSAYIAEHYMKVEYHIPMRDGKTLFTSVYIPKDTTTLFPILMTRTPYTVAPYGTALKSFIGPSTEMMKEKNIFVYQDVRGKFMSEGEYEDVRPHNPKKKSAQDIDESSDTFDTIEWLLKNVPRNNGKVGIYGISYPGFYAAHSLIDAHPALKAVSPQAPIADWYMGDDFHHNGVLFLVDGFNFYRSFGKPRPALTTTWPPGFEYPTPDGYRFLLEGGSIASLKKNYYGDTVRFWNDLFAHPNYDEFWKERSVPQHMKNITPAVLTVGGWFDAEDLYGPLHIYDAIEKNNPKTMNVLMIGPWFHGGWSRSKGDHLGNVSFGISASDRYLKSIRDFFNFYLKGEGTLQLPEIQAFETGSNVWKEYDAWPPKNREMKKLFFTKKFGLSFSSPKEKSGADEYVSDPNRPVPYTAEITNGRGREYMTEDQRFAWQRPDVLSYEMPVTGAPMTIAGPVTVNLYVSTTGSDADFVVKLIDVYPDSAKDDSPYALRQKMGGYQMLVRGDIMRARYRKSFEKPEPLKPNNVELVKFVLQDVNHSFKPGHKIMVQVQSSWFPLADRNPQQFINIYTAKDDDFVKATHRLHRTETYPSHIEIGILK